MEILQGILTQAIERVSFKHVVVGSIPIDDDALFLFMMTKMYKLFCSWMIKCLFYVIYYICISPCVEVCVDTCMCVRIKGLFVCVGRLVTFYLHLLILSFEPLV